MQSLKFQNDYLSEVLLRSSKSISADLETDGAEIDKSLIVSMFLKNIFIRDLGSSYHFFFTCNFMPLGIFIFALWTASDL